VRPQTHTTTHGEQLPHKWVWQKIFKNFNAIHNIDLDKNAKCPPGPYTQLTITILTVHMHKQQLFLTLLVWLIHDVRLWS